MKILSLFSVRNLTMIRRVIAPFSVLTKRGHSFYAQQCFSFDPAISYAYDATVLSNWVFNDEEFAAFQVAAQEKTFVYDLSDPGLLAHSRVQEQLQVAHLVTVPNDYMTREVSVLNTRVKVLPSTYDLSYFMIGRNGPAPDPKHPRIGCFGPHDWSLVQEAIERFTKKHPNVTFLGDSYAQAALGSLVQPVELTDDTYPAYLHSCLFGLCPLEGYKAVDTVWAQEYGTLSRPVIVAARSPYTQVLNHDSALWVDSASSSNEWVNAMETLLREDGRRAFLGNNAFLVANQGRATKVADQYLRLYTKMLPHLLLT